ncbi:MAG: hypothetical protein QM703_10000 [Gemmatales bacterium]
MPSSRLRINPLSQGSRFMQIGGIVLAGIFMAGCSTPGKGLNVFAPYRGSQQTEELRSPPPTDPRYTEAPSYPAPLLKPVVKIKDEETGTGLRRAPVGTAGNMPMGGPGGMPY